MTAPVNEYKDRLFNFLFGWEENRPWTLSLYNAINGTGYTDPDRISINTIREILYLGMHNDTSFLLCGTLNLYEQQSTYNPNMPLRMMQLAGNLYEKYIVEQNLNKYGSRVLRLPVPKLVVFYNGLSPCDDVVTLRLQDSFPEGSAPDICVQVRVFNINEGHNPELLRACPALGEYSSFIAAIRRFAREMPLEQAIDRAIRELPDSYEIKSFLLAHRSEVKGMLLKEYDEAKAMALFKEDGRREGILEGRREGRREGMREGRREGMREGVLSTLIALVHDGVLSVEDAASRAGVSVEEFAAMLSK